MCPLFDPNCILLHSSSMRKYTTTWTTTYPHTHAHTHTLGPGPVWKHATRHGLAGHAAAAAGSCCGGPPRRRNTWHMHAHAQGLSRSSIYCVAILPPSICLRLLCVLIWSSRHRKIEGYGQCNELWPVKDDVWSCSNSFL